MWLTCKKAWVDQSGRYPRRNSERISIGKRYKVLNNTNTNSRGERVWCFEIPQPEIKENPIGSGSFNIDEYFITPEEERDIKINQIVENDILGN